MTTAKIDDPEIRTMPLEALLGAMRDGRLDAEALTDYYLRRIERLDPAIKAYVTVDAAGARRAAAESAARYRAGKARILEGLPVAIKANIACAGLPFHAGIGALAENIATTDAEATRRLRVAGAVILGLTNMDEGALGGSCTNPHFGRTDNPWRSGYIVGGSSGGSGAAVAAGLCAAALGTDTFGSVRIPSAWCGTTALKTTPGLVPIDAVIPAVLRFDSVGPMAATIADCRVLLQALVRPALPPARKLGVVAVPLFEPEVPHDPQIAAAVARAAELLEGAGLTLIRPKLGYDIAQMRHAVYVAAALSAARNHGPAVARHVDGYSATLRSIIARSADLDAEAVERGESYFATIKANLLAVLAEADAILMPTMPTPAATAADGAPRSFGDFTSFVNVAGVPATSVPAGLTQDGLPIGVQLVGRPHEDLALLDLAETLEQALGPRRIAPGFE